MKNFRLTFPRVVRYPRFFSSSFNVRITVRAFVALHWSSSITSAQYKNFDLSPAMRSPSDVSVYMAPNLHMSDSALNTTLPIIPPHGGFFIASAIKPRLTLSSRDPFPTDDTSHRESRERSRSAWLRPAKVDDGQAQCLNNDSVKYVPVLPMIAAIMLSADGEFSICISNLFLPSQ